MRPEWNWCSVIELQNKGLLLVEDGNHGEYRPRKEEFDKEGVAFIRAADMDSGTVLFQEAEKINAAASNRIRKGRGMPGDVLLSHKGTVGKVAMVPIGSPAFVCSPQTTFWRSLDLLKIDRRFLFHFLRSPIFHQQLAARKGETDMADYVSLTAQRQLKIPIPHISIQQAISDILTPFDERITLLRETSATLEAIAQALFKSWFIDFDPVKAKAEGREPEGMDADTAALFPNEFESSELGSIPKGWKIKRLAEAFDLNPTYRLSKGVAAPYLDMANVPLSGSRVDNVIYREFGSGTKFMNGDTLLARITPCLENGKTAFVDFLEDAQIGWGSTEFIVIRSKAPVPPQFGYLLARHEPFRTYAIQHMTGTSGRQRVAADAIAGYALVIPDNPIMSKFGSLCYAVFAQIKAKDEQAKSLAELRDTLLPKLMSGQFRLPEAEALVEQAA